MTLIEEKAFEKALLKKGYCSISIWGKGRIRNSEHARVHYNIMLKAPNSSGENLLINREGIYDSNRYEVFYGKVHTIDELLSIVQIICKTH